MNSFKQVIAFFSTPVSNWTTREKWGFIISTGAFISLFLLFFQPFGVNNYDPQERISNEFLIIISLMGIWIMIVLGLNEFLIRRLFKKAFNRFNAVLWIIWSIVLLSFMVFLFYNYLGGWHDWRFWSFIEFIGNVGTLSLIPLVGLLVYLRIRDLNASLKQAYQYSAGGKDKERPLVITEENQKDKFSIQMKSLVYVNSAENYLEVHYHENGEMKKHLIRKSLKALEEESKDPDLIRVHRSFMINKMHLLTIEGNRNKLSIQMEKMDKSIPVGKQYIDTVLELF